VFLLGFLAKRVAERGFLMVNLWWNAGETWCFDGRFLGAKNMPLILDLFLRDSRFGNWRERGLYFFEARPQNCSLIVNCAERGPPKAY
jgi:hypothetical protein